MLISPWTVFWLLLVGGALGVVLTTIRSRFANVVTIAAALLASLVWLLLKTRLPVVISVLEWPGLTALTAWRWRVDGIAWQLSGLLLVVTLAASLIRMRSDNDREQGSADGTEGSPWQVSSPLLLALAGLVAIWAVSLDGLLVGWTWLIATWAWSLLATNRQSDKAIGQSLPKAGLFILSLFFIWLAAAVMPASATQELDMSQWTRVSTSSLLMAALLQMGVWPFLGWRNLQGRYSPGSAAMLGLVPAIVGATLLARVVAADHFSIGYTFYLTSFGVLGLLLAVYRAWTRADNLSGVAVVLILAQVSLALIAAVWAGADALIAEIRVMAMAAGLFFFLPEPRRQQERLWHWVSVGVAAAALMGLPLTAGFARSTVFNALLSEGRFILTLAISLMTLALMGAVLRHFIPRPGTGQFFSFSLGIKELTSHIPEIGALSIVAVTLFSLRGLSGTVIRPMTWLALLLPLLGVALARRDDVFLREMAAAMRRAFHLESLKDAARGAWVSAGTLVNRTVRDVAHILEGDGGLLWVLVLAIVIILFR